MESAAQNDDDSVGFNFQILHQSAAPGEAPVSPSIKILSSAFRVEHPQPRPSVTNEA